MNNNGKKQPNPCPAPAPDPTPILLPTPWDDLRQLDFDGRLDKAHELCEEVLELLHPVMDLLDDWGEAPNPLSKHIVTAFERLSDACRVLAHALDCDQCLAAFRDGSPAEAYCIPEPETTE